MIKNILVNLSLGERGGFAGEYAISIATAFEAHVAGIAFLYDPVIPLSGAGYIPADVIDSQERDNADATKAAADRFAQAAARAGVSAEPLTLSTSVAGAGEQFGRLARRFDLAVIGQAEPDTNAIEEVISEAALFESVMVCWDGGRQAARAAADAMPLLERAGRVEVVIVADESGKDDEIAGADMGQHLARHGLDVEVKRMAMGDIDVADVLLSHAADIAADLIVMGGYGHSRLREFVLGGVTRSILGSMTVPVFMSH